MAISCREGLSFADLCISIHFGRGTAASAIFVSIKDKQMTMGYRRSLLTLTCNLFLQLNVQAGSNTTPNMAMVVGIQIYCYSRMLKYRNVVKLPFTLCYTVTYILLVYNQFTNP